MVIRAAARNAAKFSDTLLIEATCNQVNQFGGYTGMQPADFVALVRRVAAEEKLPVERIIFGGDHLVILAGTRAVNRLEVFHMRYQTVRVSRLRVMNIDFIAFFDPNP